MRRMILLLNTVLLFGMFGPAAAQDSLPPAPYGAAVQPTADELLAVEPTAAPDRSVELRTRSEEREDDPFELPPE